MNMIRKDYEYKTGTIVSLLVPEEYALLSEKEIKERYNGCGPDGWKGKAVPETMWGLRITLACNVHDHMYMVGRTIQDKHHADIIFLYNMVSIVTTEGGFLSWLRMYRAITYFNFVHEFGEEFYWEGKPFK